MNTKHPVICFAVAAVLVGCGDRDQRQTLTRQRAEIADIPAEVLDSAKNALPDVEFSEAWKNVDREKKLHSYEIRGRIRSSGKIREVRVSTTGEILEME